MLQNMRSLLRCSVQILERHVLRLSDLTRQSRPSLLYWPAMYRKDSAEVGRSLDVRQVPRFVVCSPCDKLIMPAANLPDESITPLSTRAEMGVYYGYAQVIPPVEARREFAPEDLKVLPMVMSLGWNPFYKNERLTAVRFS